MEKSSKEVIQENRDYTLFSWAVQGASTPIHIVRGEGSCFWDGDGNRWLDFSSQLINLNVGHQHPKMLAAIKKQVDDLCFAGPNLATEPRGVLGRKLAEVTGLAKSFFTLGGAEAVENAMKMSPDPLSPRPPERPTPSDARVAMRLSWCGSSGASVATMMMIEPWPASASSSP